MRRGRWMLPAALPVLLLGADYLYWRIAVGQLRHEFKASIQRARDSGWEVRHGAVAAGGWPLAAALRIEDVTVAALGPVVWEGGAEAMLLRVGLIRPNVVEITPVGLRPLRLNDGPPIAVTADHLRVRLTLRLSGLRLDAPRLDAVPRAISIDAVTLAAALPDLGVLNVGQLNIEAELNSDAARDQAAVTFTASAGPSSLPDGVHWGLGPEVGEFQAQGVVNGPLPPDFAPAEAGSSGGSASGGSALGPSTSGPALPGAPTPSPAISNPSAPIPPASNPPASNPVSSHSSTPWAGLAARATAWRDGGGSVELHRLAIGWGPAHLDATATLALDEDLQPMGTGNGKLAGYGAALDALAVNGVLSRSAATAAKAVLSLLANPSVEGQPDEVEVPMALQYRTLSVRQIPLVRLPELEWPDR